MNDQQTPVQLPQLPAELRPNAALSLATLIGSVVVAAICVFSFRLENRFVILALAMCLIGVIAGVINLLPGATFLRLDHEGFTTSFAYSLKTVRWVDVREFALLELPRGGTMMVLSLMPGVPRPKVSDATVKQLQGYDMKLSNSGGKNNVETVRLLQAMAATYGPNGRERFAQNPTSEQMYQPQQANRGYPYGG